MDRATCERAARTVVEARLARRPLGRLEGVETIDDGYAVQARANALLAATLGPVAGSKIGGTTERMRAFIRADRPIAGEVFADTVHASGVRLDFADFVRPGIETEIAVRLARDITPDGAPYHRDRMAAFVAELMPAVELVDDRYTDRLTVGAPTIVADNAFNAASILGAATRDWRRLDLAGLRARTLIGGVVVAEDRSHMLMGHPFEALAWLANERARQDRVLPAGSFVSLGTITAAQWPAGPTAVRIEIAGLGAVELILA